MTGIKIKFCLIKFGIEKQPGPKGAGFLQPIKKDHF